MSVCLCFFIGLTVALINLIFYMHTHIRSRSTTAEIRKTLEAWQSGLGVINDPNALAASINYNANQHVLRAVLIIRHAQQRLQFTQCKVRHSVIKLETWI